MKQEHFDPFKEALAKRIESMQSVLHGLKSESEIIRERVFRPEKHLVPKFNTLYDTLRTPNAWRYMADAFAHGTISTTVNATVTANVTLQKIPLIRLSEWPNAISAHLVVRFFGIAPQAVPTTQAGMECIFYDNAGNGIPLGELLSQSGGNSVYDHIIPTPFTDSQSSGSPVGLEPAGPEGPTVGILQVTLPNVATSNGTYFFSMSFSIAYLLASKYAYELRGDVPSPVEQHKGNGHIIVEGNY